MPVLQNFCGCDVNDLVLDALVRLAQRAKNTDGLIDVDLDLLLGDPVMRVLQDVKRGLSVALTRCRMQDKGHLHLAVGFAFLRCQQC